MLYAMEAVCNVRKEGGRRNLPDPNWNASAFSTLIYDQFTRCMFIGITSAVVLANKWHPFFERPSTGNLRTEAAGLCVTGTKNFHFQSQRCNDWWVVGFLWPSAEKSCKASDSEWDKPQCCANRFSVRLKQRSISFRGLALPPQGGAVVLDFGQRWVLLVIATYILFYIMDRFSNGSPAHAFL